MYKWRPRNGLSLPSAAGPKLIMVSLVAALLLLLLNFQSLSWALPAVDAVRGGGHKNAGSIFCSTAKAPWLCPRDGTILPDVKTSIGTAHGTVDGSAVRFAVKYANAERWQESKAVSTWELP